MLIDCFFAIVLLFLMIYHETSRETAVISLLTATAFVVGVTDFRFVIIPDRLVAVLALVGLLQCSYIPGLTPIDSLAGALFGGAYFYTLSMMSERMTNRVGLGGGDIKLAAALGLFLGPLGMFVAIFVAAVLALVYWAVKGLIRGNMREHSVPFGPFLIVGTIVLRLEFVSYFPSIMNWNQ